MKENNVKLEIAKKIVGAVGKFCIGMLFGAITAHVTADSGLNKFEKGATYIGAGLAGLMVGNSVENYLDDGIDVLYDKYSNKTLKEVEEMGGGV